MSDNMTPKEKFEATRPPRSMFSGTLGEWEELYPLCERCGSRLLRPNEVHFCVFADEFNAPQFSYHMLSKSAMFDDFCDSTREAATIADAEGCLKTPASIRHAEIMAALARIEAKL